MTFVFIIFSFSVVLNDVIISDVQVLITGNENHSDKKQKRKIYTKKAVTKPAQPEKIEFLQKDTGGRWTGLSACYFLLAF